jgi:hypothetical protein
MEGAGPHGEEAARLSVSKIASLFVPRPPAPEAKDQQERRPVLLQRTESRVNRFSNARARFQTAEGSGACHGALPAPEPRSSGRRTPSQGCRTEELVRSFSQLAGSPVHGGPGHWGRHSLPEGLGPWAADKENSPGWSPLTACCRPVARVAPGGTMQHSNPAQCPVSARSPHQRGRWAIRRRLS